MVDTEATGRPALAAKQRAKSLGSVLWLRNIIEWVCVSWLLWRCDFVLDSFPEVLDHALAFRTSAAGPP